MNDQLIQFSLDDLEGMIRDAVSKFFTTMLDLEAVFVDSSPGVSADDLDEPPPPVLQSEKPVIVGMIGFVGTICGVINLYLEEEMAMNITGSFLGMTPEEVKEEGVDVINDTLGEMSNMIVGTFKNAMCDRGEDCRMTVPSILRGTNFSIETPAETFRRIYNFRIMGDRFVADITLQPGDLS